MKNIGIILIVLALVAVIVAILLLTKKKKSKGMKVSASISGCPDSLAEFQQQADYCKNTKDPNLCGECGIYYMKSWPSTLINIYCRSQYDGGPPDWNKFIENGCVY